jgi:hypothetical protein
VSALTTFGFTAVGAMFAFYWLEDRSAWFVLAFAVACLASALYGLIAGTLPFAVVEMAWAAVALVRFRKRRAVARGSR